MKFFVLLILPAIFLSAFFSIAPSSHLNPSGAHTILPVAAVSSQNSENQDPQKQDKADKNNDNADTLIQPGASVGPLKLGDTHARALELFPQKPEDQEWKDACGTTLNWVDTANKIRGGNLFIRLKKDKVFQIESATTRFHTAEDIASLDSPEKVEQNYKDMRAYVLLTPPNAALGDRPLVYWIDKKKGIAFAFAYYPSQHKRYLYKIIVFESNKTFCPEEETTGSPKWQPIRPYSIEPPSDLALNLHQGYPHQDKSSDKQR